MVENKFRMALLGVGAVGSKVAEILYEQKEKIRQSSGYTVELAYGYVREVDDPGKIRLANDYHFELTNSFDQIINDESIDVVIELMGRVHPAKKFIEQALKARKSVITANKDVIAQYGYELNQLAIDSGVWLVYEASVAGGIPIVDTLETHFSFDEVKDITGIMNGTTNYILTKMLEESLSYDEALIQAQELGFAESDPTNDVEGIDAAYKVMVLAQLAFQTYIDFADVKVKGITSITYKLLSLARQFGYRIKLLGQLQRTNSGCYFRVEPFFVAENHLLANVTNETNALSILSKQIGQIVISGPGAGPSPTAASVLADVFRLVITKENRKILTSNRAHTKEDTPDLPKNSVILSNENDVISSYGILIENAKEEIDTVVRQAKWIETVKRTTQNHQEIVWIETKQLSLKDIQTIEQTLGHSLSILEVFPIVK